MNGVYGGLIVILLYEGAASTIIQDFYLITQDNKDILTDNNLNILVQPEE